MKRIYFVTGTDTGIGKTVLTVLLVKFLRERNVSAAALKPICSGDRDDAMKLFAVMDKELPLDEINPWCFAAPIAPVLAARRENRIVKLPKILGAIRRLQIYFDVLLVEGAGGLLSPLGKNFDSRDLILKLNAMPILVAPNRLGAVNQIRLTLEALPKKFCGKTKIVLFSQAKPDAASPTNAKLLADFFPEAGIFPLPWFGKIFSPDKVLNDPRVRRTFDALAQ